MKRWERWSFNALNVAVAVTGIAYFCMKYLLATDDPFAVVNHTWQPSMLSLHVVTAPLLILFFGIVFRGHTLKKLKSSYQPDRRTGWVSLLSFSAMALSGYLLQVTSNLAWLGPLVVAHVATGVVFLVGYSTHLVIGWRVAKAPDTTAVSDADLPSTARLPL